MMKTKTIARGFVLVWALSLVISLAFVFGTVPLMITQNGGGGQLPTTPVVTTPTTTTPTDSTEDVTLPPTDIDGPVPLPPDVLPSIAIGLGIAVFLVHMVVLVVVLAFLQRRR